MADSTAALNRARKLGLARHIGVSNYTSTMLDEVTKLSQEPLVADQVEYHPFLDQTKIHAACRRHGLAMTSYCPLGRSGVLSDATVQAIAKAHGKTASQIVLRWHVQQPGVVAIPKSGSRQHIIDNLAVFDFELTVDEMKRISGLARADGRVVDPSFAPRWDRAA